MTKQQADNSATGSAGPAGSIGARILAGLQDAPTQSAFADLREFNTAYLLLAQRLLNQDRASAMFRLGLTPALAERFIALTPIEVSRLANCGLSLCNFGHDMAMLQVLLDPERHSGISALHGLMMRAGRAHAAARATEACAEAGEVAG